MPWKSGRKSRLRSCIISTFVVGGNSTSCLDSFDGSLGRANNPPGSWSKLYPQVLSRRPRQSGYSGPFSLDVRALKSAARLDQHLNPVPCAVHYFPVSPGWRVSPTRDPEVVPTGVDRPSCRLIEQNRCVI
ncbi:uncharacterized protein BJX67DRAFT_191119 [Aspergillus lucknowensis]|uniref:Uncharacterized protein n=1 Tax=Aspergillus lucknowensis TaxID=176173 RepID=A0ABR4LNS3_9EURO